LRLLLASTELDLERKNEDGRTALSIALETGYDEVAHLLHSYYAIEGE
jgi:ankyrin repeat protein